MTSVVQGEGEAGVRLSRRGHSVVSDRSDEWVDIESGQSSCQDPLSNPVTVSR